LRSVKTLLIKYSEIQRRKLVYIYQFPERVFGNSFFGFDPSLGLLKTNLMYNASFI